MVEELQRVNPLTPLTKIHEEFQGVSQPPEVRQKKNVIEQNRESMKVLSAMMGGVANSPIGKRKRV